MLKYLENMTQHDARKLQKNTPRTPDASKEDPEQLPESERHPGKVPRRAQGPRCAPEAHQARKASNSFSKIDVYKKNHQNP